MIIGLGCDFRDRKKGVKEKEEEEDEENWMDGNTH